jgi:predicted TIM-barrel fold metal-dependent hydrolase
LDVPAKLAPTSTPIRGIDCHAHIVDPATFAFVDGPGYRPTAGECGTREAYANVLRDNGISHAVLVQPSCYAFDNRAMLDAIARSEGCWKGIAVVPDDVDEPSLDRLQRDGIVGVRVNLGAFDAGFFARPGAGQWLRRMQARGWLVQVYARASRWPGIAPMLMDSGVTVVVDHLGHPDVREPVAQPGFQAVLGLGRIGRAYIKLSAPYRSSLTASPHADLTPFVRAAIDAFGIDRCIFGSDWPFLNTGPTIHYVDQLAWLAHEVPDPASRRKVLDDNPRLVYGFASSRTSTVSAVSDA